MFISYKLSSKSLGSLMKKGFSEQAVQELRVMEDQFFDSSETFLYRVSKLDQFQEFREREDQLLKAGKGYFRLDRLIPNRTLREWVEAIILALVVAGIVRTYMFAPFQIPSGSMIPTIQIGDHIFASMYSYGSPIPFTDIKVFEKPIQRGEIVIFPYPKDPDIDYIKRAIGMPGEVLEIRKDQVYINGEPLEEPYAYYDPDQRRLLDLQAQGGSYPISNFGPVQIPKGKLFVMGDNRYNSADSRYWGFVDEKSVMGKGQVIYWSHDPRESLLEGYQFSRIFSFLK